MYRNDYVIALLRSELDAELRKPKKPAPVIIPDPGRGEDRHVRPTKGSCERVADELEACFAWDDTREGHAFWSAVSDRLRELSQHPQAR